MGYIVFILEIRSAAGRESGRERNVVDVAKIIRAAGARYRN
jgi:hypothetical protein